MAKDLQDAVEVSHSGAVAVEKVGEDELAVRQVVFRFLDLIGHFLEEVGLDSGEGFQGGFAGADEFRVGVSPLGDFVLPLAVGLVGVLQDLLVDLKKLFDQQVLSVLDFYQLASQGDQGGGEVGRSLLAGLRTGRIGGDVDGEDGGKRAGIVGHSALDRMRTDRGIDSLQYKPRRARKSRC